MVHRSLYDRCCVASPCHSATLGFPCNLIHMPIHVPNQTLASTRDTTLLKLCDRLVRTLLSPWYNTRLLHPCCNRVIPLFPFLFHQPFSPNDCPFENSQPMSEGKTSLPCLSFGFGLRKDALQNGPTSFLRLCFRWCYACWVHLVLFLEFTSSPLAGEVMIQW